MFETDSEQEAVLESVYIELDPVLEGFSGVLVELVTEGNGYILTETAAGSGDRILRFSSTDLSLVYEMFRGQLS